MVVLYDLIATANFMIVTGICKMLLHTDDKRITLFIGETRGFYVLKALPQRYIIAR